jgi:hypothetical protein
MSRVVEYYEDGQLRTDVPSQEILDETMYLNLYMEKVLKRDDVIDAEFEAPNEWPK